METGGLWGMICLFAFVIVSVMVFRLAAHAAGRQDIADLV